MLVIQQRAFVTSQSHRRYIIDSTLYDNAREHVCIVFFPQYNYTIIIYFCRTINNNQLYILFNTLYTYAYTRLNVERTVRQKTRYE